MTRMNFGGSSLITVLTAIALVAVGWFGRGLIGFSREAAKGGVAVPTVAVETVVKRAVNPVGSYIGHVEPIQEVDVLPQIDGYIAKVHFKEGDLVKAGDPLFEIDRERYAAACQVAQAALSRAEAEVCQADAELDKAMRFFNRMSATDQRGIAQREKDVAETDLAAAKAKSAMAKAAVKESQAQLAVSEFNLNRTMIRAAFAGRIGKSFVHVGDYVAPSRGAMAHLVQVSPIRVSFPVSDRTFLDLVRYDGRPTSEIGRDYRVRLRTADGIVYPGVGRWAFVDNEMNAAATVLIRAEFDNADELLKSRQYIEVLVDESFPSTVPVVPKSALVHGAKSDGLWLLRGDGTVSYREVKLGRGDGNQFEVLAGVAEGDRFVSQGVSKVAEGLKVEVVPALDLGPSEDGAR